MLATSALNSSEPAATPDIDDLRMACPMNLIAAVTIEQIRHEDGTVDRKIAITLDCGCHRFYSLPLTVPAPRPGDPARCWGTHGR